MKTTITIFLITILFSIVTSGQSKLTKNTLRLQKTEKTQKAKVTDMAWMAGNWVGEGLGGTVEESWTKPRAGVMMGMFRLIKNDKPVFYEFMTFSIKNESLVLRLKHFTDDMVSWEEKEKTVDFRFVKKEGNRYYFHGLTFESVGEKGLKIYLALRQKDKNYKEMFFKFTKMD